MSLLELDGVAKLFADGTGLQPTSFSVDQGEFISILGPSGCGKSTLLRCVAGLERPDRGSIVLRGKDVTRTPPSRRNLSMVFQDLALWPHMTVAQNVEFPLTARGQHPDDTKARVQRALAMVGIESKAQARPHQLSGGQQQRVAIARGIVDEPDLLLMDEPLSALDAALREQIRAELTELVGRLGLTVLYVTHDQSETLAMSDRVLVMNAGQVSQFDTPVNLYEHPADEFVGNFVGSMNRYPDGRAFRPERFAIGGGEGTPATVRTCQYVGGGYEVRASVDGVDRPWHVRSETPVAPGTTITITQKDALQ